MEIIRINDGNVNISCNNQGDGNFGDNNHGDNNVGNYNVGNYNKGDHNIGTNNVGNYNKGNHNVGDNNIGSYNYGNYNTGSRNVGNYNIGSYNYGDYNYCDHSIGCFNTNDSNDTIIRFFDKESLWGLDDWNFSEAKSIIDRLVTNEFIWEELSEEDKNEVLSIPNFNAEKFEKCTGISTGYIKNDTEIMNYLVENHFETEIENFLKGLDPKNKIELNTLYNEMLDKLTKTFKEYSEKHY